jgi:hypothetical protein
MSTKKAIDQRAPTGRHRPVVLLWVSWGLILGGVGVASVPLAWQEYTNAIGKATAEEALASWDAAAPVDARGVDGLGSPRGAKPAALTLSFCVGRRLRRQMGW